MKIKIKDIKDSFLNPFQYFLCDTDFVSRFIYLNLSIKIKVENLPQNKHIGKIKIIWFWTWSRHAICMRVIKNNDWTPNAPTWLSFIAFKHLFFPAKIPSKVSIKPSRWSPPVIKYPEARQIRTDA